MKIADIIFENKELNEITRPDTQPNAVALLKKYGYKQIGDGLFANVLHYGTSPDVLKLYGADDIGYRTFIGVVQNNSNIHFPKFRSKVTKITQFYHAIRIEKLMPLPSAAYKVDGFYLVNVIRSTIKKFFNNDHLTDEEFFTNYAEQDDVRFFKDNAHASLYAACKLLGQSAKEYEVGIDIHTGNVMLRSNGEIVITDPFID